MAINILSTIQEITFTSEIPPVVVTCENAPAEITLLNSSNFVVFTNTYYPYNKNFTVRNFAQVIESYMTRSSAVMNFTLKITQGVSEALIPFTAIYCNMKMPISAKSWIKSRFLTTVTSKITYVNVVESISLYSETEEVVKISGVFRNESNQNVPFSFDFKTIAANTLTAFSISCAIIASHLPVAKEILAYTVIAGNRSVAFYIDKNKANRIWGFLFKNCFCCNQHFYANGITLKKSSITAEDSYLNNQLRQYNRKHSCTYETETLIDDETASSIDQFLASESIFLVKDSKQADPVLITESTCEISDDFGAINKIKFTWRFANEIPVYFLNNNMRDIFSQEYDVHYD